MLADFPFQTCSVTYIFLLIFTIIALGSKLGNVQMEQTCDYLVINNNIVEQFKLREATEMFITSHQHNGRVPLRTQQPKELFTKILYEDIQKDTEYGLLQKAHLLRIQEIETFIEQDPDFSIFCLAESEEDPRCSS